MTILLHLLAFGITFVVGAVAGISLYRANVRHRIMRRLDAAADRRGMSR